MSDNSKYQMTLSMNVLEHLGLHLYSNMSAVIAEAVANAWDADATKVEIRVAKDKDTGQDTVTIQDNGVGMALGDINNKFLRVGYKRREEPGAANRTSRGRLPMGRKGIGKLSLFSIAEKIYIYTKKGESQEAFLMDAAEMKKRINDDKPYNPHPIPFDIGEDYPKFSHGTIIKITDLKKEIRGQVIGGLRKRIARRFSVMSDDFSIQIDGKPVSFEDRDYFHKARFLFEYGNRNFAQYCRNLDKDNKSGNSIVYKCENTFDKNGDPNPSGMYSIEGWIAVAHSTKELDGSKADNEDNLNKITLAVRGKVGQEDLLHDHRIGGIVTKYLYGEIHADFLDNDSDEDIATSNRQNFKEHDMRYVALKKFMAKELKKIHGKTNDLMARGDPKKAARDNQHIDKWLKSLSKDEEKQAEKFLEIIGKTGVDEKETLYLLGILAFEKLKTHQALQMIEMADPNDIGSFIEALNYVDRVEEANYHEIVGIRLKIIQKLTARIRKGHHGNEIQKCLFNRLWLLNPGWEQSTEDGSMEKILRSLENAESDKGKNERVGISYRKFPHEHAIVELKKPDVQTTMAELMGQMSPYIQKIRIAARRRKEISDQVVGIILVGTWPQGWDDLERRNEEERALKEMSIRVMHYKTLLFDSQKMYQNYFDRRAEVQNLHNLIKNIQGQAKKQE